MAFDILLIFKKIENYSLENVNLTFNQTKISLEIFINTKIKNLDFSGNYF
jgi:hypothetical protein